MLPPGWEAEVIANLTQVGAAQRRHAMGPRHAWHSATVLQLLPLVCCQEVVRRPTSPTASLCCAGGRQAALPAHGVPAAQPRNQPAGHQCPLHNEHQRVGARLPDQPRERSTELLAKGSCVACFVKCSCLRWPPARGVAFSGQRCEWFVAACTPAKTAGAGALAQRARGRHAAPTQLSEMPAHSQLQPSHAGLVKLST